MRRLPKACLFLGCLALASCASLSIDNIAPPVPEGQATLKHGRRIYLTKCARCHAPEPIVRYSREEWARILPDMIADTKLPAADGEALTLYVNSVAR